MVDWAKKYEELSLVGRVVPGEGEGAWPNEDLFNNLLQFYQDYYFYLELEREKVDIETRKELGRRFHNNENFFLNDPLNHETIANFNDGGRDASRDMKSSLMTQLSEAVQSGSPTLEKPIKLDYKGYKNKVAVFRGYAPGAPDPNYEKKLKDAVEKALKKLQAECRKNACVAGYQKGSFKYIETSQYTAFDRAKSKLPAGMASKYEFTDSDYSLRTNEELWNEYLTLSRMAPGEEEGSTVRGDQIEEEKKKIQEKRENAEKRLEELRAQNDGTRTKDDPIFAEMKRLEAEIQQCEASVKVLDREAEGLAQEVTNAGDKGSIKTRRAACKAEIEARLEIPEFREFVNKRMAENAAAGNQEFLTNNAFSALDDAAKNNQRVYEFLLFENDFSLGQRDWYKKPTLKRDKENPYMVPSSYKGADVAPVTKEEPPKPDKTETPPERPTTQTIVDPKGPQQARTDASVEEEKRKDLEAIIQTDQRSWLMRNWEWLVAVLLLIAATAFGVFQHKRSKKKEKAAKSEKAAVEASNTELSGRLDEVNAEINSLKTLAAGSDGEGKPNDSGSAATGGFFTYGDLVDTNRTNSSSTDRTQLLIAQTNRNNNK